MKNDYIFYGELFAESYLVGEEVINQAREGTFLKIAPDHRLLEIDADPVNYTDEARGWAMFGAEQFEILCGAEAMRINDLILDYAGPPD